jgi:hypothetical protein
MSSRSILSWYPAVPDATAAGSPMARRSRDTRACSAFGASAGSRSPHSSSIRELAGTTSPGAQCQQREQRAQPHPADLTRRSAPSRTSIDPSMFDLH